jgi:hypothetical protein
MTSSICPQCGKDAARKFCSQSCAATYNNTHRVWKNDRSRSKTPFVCLGCGVHDTYDPKSSGGLYCSNKCQGDHIWRTVSIPKIEAGEGGNLKRYLTEARGYRCEVVDCGLSEWMGKPITLHLDHIDGNSDNDQVDNVRLLCPNCHSQTETYCGRNTKNTKRNSYLRVYKSTRKQSRGKGATVSSSA